MATPKIDTHHHILPPRFVEGGSDLMQKENAMLILHVVWSENPAVSQGMRLPEWSPEHSLDFMTRNNIDASILSLGAPITSMGKSSAEVASFCREMNVYAADLRNQHPGKLGFFATLPSLEDSQACIDEIQYSIETLRADGVNLLTSYGGKYLGHPDFQPIWRQLNGLAAVVFVHPGLEGMEKAIQEPHTLPSPIFDWTHETTRTAAHLIMTNTLTTYSACKIILSHGGGTLPYVAHRVAHLSASFRLMDKSAESFLTEASTFYFDLAFAGYQGPLKLLLDFAQPGHVLYGSDYPFGRENLVSPQLQTIDRFLYEREDAALIARDNALTLFPRLKESIGI